MADNFHRLVAPVYYTGGPAFPSESGVTYDYINNGGSGTPAFADTAKVGGPNAGTYLAAFGEDATSANINRGPKALAENCDHLDNLLHRSIASAVRTSDVTPVSPVSTIILPTGTFLGVAGYTATVADLNRLFEITDTLDEEIVDVASNTKVTITGVTLGSGDAIGGGGANGSFSGNTVQLNISPSIPASQAYRVYYGTRSNLATLPLDALTSIKVRGANEVSAQVETVLANLHGGTLPVWNAAWDTTIHDLALNGLHQRYMHATSISVSAADLPPTAETYWPTSALNSLGGGGFIVRRGPAVTVYTQNSGLYADPLNALFAAKFFDSTPASAGGAVGMAVYGSRRTSTAWTGESTGHTPGAGAFAQLWPHYFDGTLSTTLPKTRVVSGTSALFNLVGAYDINTGEAIVQLTAANNYFRAGGVSAVNVGYDLLECSHLVGATPVTRTYVIVGHGSSATPTDATKVRIRNLDGTVPNFTTPVTGTVKWISTTMWVGDGAAEYHSQANTDVKPSALSSLFYQVPPLLSTGSDDDVPRVAPTFSASANTSAAIAMQWGGFNPTDSVSAPVMGGSLRGDGSIRLTGPSISAGNLTLSSGSLTVSAGNIAVSAGNITVPAGAVTVSGLISTTLGNISAGGTSGASGSIIGNSVVTNLQVLPTNFSAGGAIVCSANLGSFITCIVPLNGQTVIPLIGGLKAGQTIYILVNHTTDMGNGPPIFDWSNNTNHFPNLDDQVGPDPGYTLFSGVAISTTEIFWTTTRY